MGRSRYRYFSHENGPYFVTCSVLQGIPCFGIPEVVKIILKSLEFLIRKERIVLHTFIIMENHLHLILSGQNVSKEVHDFKSYTARMIIDYLISINANFILKQLQFFKKLHKHDQKYQFWDEGSHPELIFNREMLNQKINYVHYNPVERGYIEDPAHWRYSSYKNYLGEPGLLPIEIIGL